VNCYCIHHKSLNFIHPFKFYSNFTNKNVSWLHFSWATQYTIDIFNDLDNPLFKVTALLKSNTSETVRLRDKVTIDH